MRIIIPIWTEQDGETTVKVDDCNRTCIVIAKGAEYPEECEYLAMIGSKIYCNDTCLK